MHHHLNREQRYALGALKRAGFSLREIARELSVHHSTVSREVRRNTGGSGYNARHASWKAVRRRRDSKREYRLIERHPELAARIASLLHPLRSPETAAHEVGISHETIYAWIARSRPDLYPLLPQRGRKRRRYGSKRASKIGWTKHVRPIDARTETGESWEGDTMKGGGLARLLTHVERTSLYAVVDVLPRGTADAVHAVTVRHGFRGSITYDRGSEFSLWAMIERDLHIPVYFARPHHPWQRGKNENTNGRIRRVFPKRFDFSTITQRQLDRVVFTMNHTPRKSLAWRTPAEVFRGVRCVSD